MVRGLVALVLMLVCAVTVPTIAEAGEGCWIGNGKKQVFGSTEQCEALKKVVDQADSCTAIGISWSVALPGGTRDSVLVWTPSTQTLVRIHSLASAIDWESWQGVTRKSIEAEDCSDGFDFGDYNHGQGKAPLSKDARTHIKANDKEGWFKGAL